MPSQSFRLARRVSFGSPGAWDFTLVGIALFAATALAALCAGCASRGAVGPASARQTAAQPLAGQQPSAGNLPSAGNTAISARSFSGQVAVGHPAAYRPPTADSPAANAYPPARPAGASAPPASSFAGQPPVAWPSFEDGAVRFASGWEEQPIAAAQGGEPAQAPPRAEPAPSEDLPAPPATRPPGDKKDDKKTDAKDGDKPRDRGEPETIPTPPSDQALPLAEVVSSVHATFPLVRAAYLEANLADANRLAAQGEWDLKLKGSSENDVLGFYETYRHAVGLTQPLYHGGEVFGGYRIGRGFFQPWYLERQTNDGGEFKAGFNVPLVRDRAIDARRAAAWRATYDQQLAQPEIRLQLVQFVRDASVFYWGWVAAGRAFRVGENALELAQKRNQQISRRVQTGDLDPPALEDNRRTIADRENKLIDRERKLEQAAIKLSLFLRGPDAAPLVPDRGRLAGFPEPDALDLERLETDAALALARRPEMETLALLQRRYEVDLQEARNDLLPNVDAQVVGSQDMGPPTSSKRDKSEFELEVALFADMPLQRRKGRGKAEAVRVKMAQLAAKRQFTGDKIVAEVRQAYANLAAAHARVGKAREAMRLAEYMATVERRKFDLGETDLLAVFLREQAAIEAADAEIEALFEYHVARAEYTAALAFDWRVETALHP